MAYTMLNVTGTVLMPDGSPAANALLSIRLSAPARIGYDPDTPGNVAPVVCGTFRVIADDNGDVSFYIARNGDLTPADTVYYVTYDTGTGVTWSEVWSIPADASSPWDLGQVALVL